MATREELVEAIRGLRASRSPIVVAISGYGGSGKSTLADALVAEVPGSVRLSGDDFLRPDRFDQRSPDIDVVDGARLGSEVERFRATAASGATLIVEGIGIVHPELADAFDLTVWIDVPLDIATARGKARDRAAANDHDRLWDEVWEPNERDYDARFAPREAADLLYQPEA